MLNATGDEIIIIDEIGALETGGRGWSSGIDGILTRPVRNLIISVRESQLEAVKEKWKLSDAVTIEILRTGNETALNDIIGNLQL